MLNAPRINSIVASSKPDIIYGPGAMPDLIPWITKWGKTAVTIHGSPQMSQIRAEMGGTEDHLRDTLFGIAHTLPSRMVSFVKPDISAYVYVSSFCLQDTVMRIKRPSSRQAHLKRSHVIYNGLDVDYLRNLDKQVAKLDGYDQRSAVFIGRLMEYKGIRFLLKAFEIVARDVTDSKLHIIGNGPLYSDANEFVKKRDLTGRIILHGFLPRTDAMKILAKSGFLVHPSFYESFGMIIPEAYALGKPVVAHKAGYAFEMVHSDTGVLVDASNIEEFAEALRSMFTDASSRKKFSDKAVKIAEEKFDIRVTATRYESLFNEIMSCSSAE